MARNTPYKGMKKTELNKLLKQSKSVTSFAGPEYVAMHKSVIQEIQTQKDRNAKAAQRSLHMMINSGYSYKDSLQLQSDVRDFINGLQEIARDNNSILQLNSTQAGPLEESQINNLCELAISSITIENQAEPKAEKILVRGEKAQSRKLYNIRFNWKGLVSLLFDWVLLGQVSSEQALELIVMLIRSIGKLYDLSLIKFDYIHAVILQEWYRTPKENGAVEEDKLVEILLTKYKDKIPDLSQEKIRGAIEQMVDFHCADIEDGKVIITESLVIK